jgi:putative DNA primase/helicase
MTPRDADHTDTSRVDDALAIARLAMLSPLEYERARVTEAAALRCRVAALDDAVERARAAAGGNDATHGRGVALNDPEPWSEPVSTAAILDLLADAVRRHVFLPPGVADVVGLWIAHTWTHERFDHSPRLGITSPTRRCGKSTLLEVLLATCRRTLKADNISASAVFRAVEVLRPLTLLVDEADTFLKDNEELRGVLNSGFERTGQAIRVVEQKGEHVPMVFATYAPVALAAIGELPSTLADRAVPVRMERRAPGDSVQKLRTGRNRAALADLARMLARWADDTGPALPLNPALPDALNDREGDISVPLLAIAEHAGPAWAARARKALLSVFNLRAENEGNQETGALLLEDIKSVFAELGATRMPSVDLCQRLGAMDDRPWPEWRHSKPMTPPQLAAVLRPFRIRPTTYRPPGGAPVKGYLLDSFEEAFARYLAPATPSSPTEGGSESLPRNIAVSIDNFAKMAPETRNSALQAEILQSRSLGQQCYGVTGSTPPDWESGAVDDEVAL